MLTQMERHPFPFACTTDAPELLGCGNRSALPVQGPLFLPMTAAQVELAYHRAFRCSAPRSVLELSALTPGDFAVVARKAAALGETNQSRLAKWLEEEVEAKPNVAHRQIGYWKRMG